MILETTIAVLVLIAIVIYLLSPARRPKRTWETPVTSETELVDKNPRKKNGQINTDDLIGEVEIYLAYEEFDKAEGILREAINTMPDNVELHSKLLEVFYASGDRECYKKAALVLYNKVGGEGQEWEMAVEMWQSMSPGMSLIS